MKKASAQIGRRILSLMLVFGILLTASACAFNRGAADPALIDCPVIREQEFGGVYIKITIDDFNALGFRYGDSVTIRFSNGYVLEDIPYYNGYYTANGEPLLVAYPGYDYIDAAINNGDSLWKVAALQEGDLASVTLQAREKYLDIQNARDIHYTDERTDYESDAVFANFRSVKAGNLKENTLYRSASPCDNRHNRAPYVDALMADAQVDFILNLSDNDEKIETYLAAEDFSSPYFRTLYEAGKVVPLAMNTNFGSQEFRAKLAAGLGEMAKRQGPYLVHCTEGKDRTGFVCMLLEMLCGAGYDEIVADYMKTYENYYGITGETDEARYNVILEKVLVPMMQIVAAEESPALASADLAGYARQYLKDAGMDDGQIAALTANLTEQQQ